MPSPFLPLCRFHLQRIFHQAPLQGGMLLAAGLALSIAALCYTAQIRMVGALDGEHQALATKAKAMLAKGPQPASSSPEFQAFDATRLVSALSHLAAQAQLPLTDISYTLDDNANRPYLRYRATLTVAANYHTIRDFIDHVGSGLEDVSLDNISCARDDIKTAALKCDLAFSAFYRKTAHG